jgi:hypothetical protein
MEILWIPLTCAPNGLFGSRAGCKTVVHDTQRRRTLTQ